MARSKTTKKKSAAEPRLEPDIGCGQIELKRKGAVDGDDIADRAGIDQLTHAKCAGMVRPHEAVHELDRFGSAIGDDRGGFVGRRRERLLAKNVFSGVGGFARPFGMHGIGQRQVNRFDRLIGEKVFVAPV